MYGHIQPLESFYRDDMDGMRGELLLIPREAPPRVLDELREILKPRPKYLGPGIW